MEGSEDMSFLQSTIITPLVVTVDSRTDYECWHQRNITLTAAVGGRRDTREEEDLNIRMRAV